MTATEPKPEEELPGTEVPDETEGPDEPATPEDGSKGSVA